MYVAAEKRGLMFVPSLVILALTDPCYPGFQPLLSK